MQGVGTHASRSHLRRQVGSDRVYRSLAPAVRHNLPTMAYRPINHEKQATMQSMQKKKRQKKTEKHALPAYIGALFVTQQTPERSSSCRG